MVSCFPSIHGVVEPVVAAGWVHPSYAFPEPVAIDVARAVQYGQWRNAPEGVTRRFGDADVAVSAVSTPRSRESATASAGKSVSLSPEEVRTVPAPTARTPSRRRTTPRRWCARRSGFGYPLAVKLASPTITHKSDVGGVVSACAARTSCATRSRHRERLRGRPLKRWRASRCNRC